jgi:hypothetical protein
VPGDSSNLGSYLSATFSPLVLPGPVNSMRRDSTYDAGHDSESTLRIEQSRRTQSSRIVAIKNSEEWIV